MPSVIFDNSTLTAVQRLTGDAPAPNSYDVQGDYSALESFFTSLIFYDDFYFIDDYKPEFREQRRERFSYCRSVATAAFPYNETLSAAKILTENLMLDIRGGRMQVGVIKDFLESIGLYLTGAWHMQSSDYFLVLKILADGGDELKYKYSPLSALIFNQLSGRGNEAETEEKYCLLDSGGNAIHKESTDGQINFKIDNDLMTFAKSLNWLTMRASFYALLSGHFDASVCLHPIRHNFLAQWTSQEKIVKVSDVWRQKLTSFFSGEAAAAINAINAASEATEIGIDLPLFAAWAVGKTGNVSDAISFILDIRQNPEAVALRQHLNELDELQCGNEIGKHKTELNKLRTALEIEAGRMQNKFGQALVGKSASTVSMTAQFLPVPKISAGARINLDNLGLKFGKPRHFRSLFRNVVADVIQFDSLGDVRGKLMKQVRRTKDLTTPTLRVEDKKFLGKSSSWKLPM